MCSRHAPRDVPMFVRRCDKERGFITRSVMATENAMLETFATYDIDRSYEWNYEHAPSALELELPAREAAWQFCGLAVETPLGIAAGPLLNGDWVLYYASLGYSVLTYKTVRSVARESYPLPNLLPVKVGSLSAPGGIVESSDRMHGSWAISFGMPSMSPGGLAGRHRTDPIEDAAEHRAFGVGCRHRARRRFARRTRS